jgi:hypothetical protein
MHEKPLNALTRKVVDFAFSPSAMFTAHARFAVKTQYFVRSVTLAICVMAALLLSAPTFYTSVGLCCRSARASSLEAGFVDAPGIHSSGPCATSRLAERPGRPGSPPVQFVHLAKSGGEGINFALSKWALASNVSITRSKMNEEFWHWRVPNASDPSTGVLLVHRGWGFCAQTPANAVKLVVMRDPIARVISKFDFANRWLTYFRGPKTLLTEWVNQTLDRTIEIYNRTRSTDPVSLLPDGNASLHDKVRAWVCPGTAA